MSNEFCIRISVSISTPNAFSNRNAISPDSPAFVFNRLDSARRETPNAFAASVTGKLVDVQYLGAQKPAGVNRVQHLQWLFLNGSLHSPHPVQPGNPGH